MLFKKLLITTSKMIIFAAQDGLPPQSLCSESKHAIAHLYKDADDINSVFTSEVLGFLEPGPDCVG